MDQATCSHVMYLLQDKYEESMMKKKALEDELEDLEGKLQRAEKLLSGKVSHALSSYCTSDPAALLQAACCHVYLVGCCIIGCYTWLTGLKPRASNLANNITPLSGSLQAFL